MAILNSSIGSYWIKKNCVELGDGYELRFIFMQNIPIPDINPTKQAIFVDLTEQILALTETDDYATNSDMKNQVAELQKQIDQHVYALYHLTEEEIKLIEDSFD